MTWILVLVMYHGSAGVYIKTIDGFPTQVQCAQAAEVIKADNKLAFGAYRVNGSCIVQGKQ